MFWFCCIVWDVTLREGCLLYNTGFKLIHLGFNLKYVRLLVKCMRSSGLLSLVLHCGSGYTKTFKTYYIRYKKGETSQ
jgi:hypothetical protein